MDALSRLQTQVQYNTAGLQTQRRDFENLNHAVNRLADEMERIENMVGALRRELQARPLAPAAPAQTLPGKNIDDATLEVFATNLTSVANKVTEVDALKMQLEILKRRVKIMEETSAPSGGPQSSSAPPPSNGSFASPREAAQIHPPHSMQHASHPGQMPPHPPPPPHQAPSFHASHASPQVPRIGTPSHAELRPDLRPAPPVQPYHHPAAPQEMHTVATPGSQPNSQGNGWVSVNPSSKRQHPNGVDSPMDGRSETMGSPKRPKLAPLEPRIGPEQVTTPMRYDPVERDGRDYHAEAMREQQQYVAATPTTFVPYNSSEQPHPEDKWHAESQRATSSAGKDSRRTRGGGRGRGRRSLPADSRELGTPEWESSSWNGNGTQPGPDGYYQMDVTPNGTKVPRGSSIVRRGSSGSGPIAMRPIEMTRPGSSGDPYAHTKKTRTKPIRNSDGVLIRKDGKPDMRSQSSAANLRKVHARKEQERIMEQGGSTPMSGMTGTPLATDSQNGSQTNGSTPDRENAPSTALNRHEAIMKQIFPNGVDDTVNRRNFHDQFFPGGSSPTVTKIKPEVLSPSERDSMSEVGEAAEKTNDRSPTTEVHESDQMDVSQDRLAPQPVSQAA